KTKSFSAAGFMVTCVWATAMSGRRIPANNEIGPRPSRSRLLLLSKSASPKLAGAHYCCFTANGREFTRINGRDALPRTASLQRLVITGRELGEEVVLVEREVLDERHGHDLLLRIDLAIRRRCAIPAELPDGRRDGELPQIGRHFHAETEAFLSRCRLVVRQCDQVIRRHQLDRFAPENSASVQRAAVQQHL